MDIALHYTKTGTGSPLLLLHGNGEDGSYFVHQIAYFSKRYTVYAIDTRGHGKSPRGTVPFTISQFADDLLDFMDEQQMEKANILGFSDGGNIALTFALRHPERVDRLILNGANLDPAGVKRSAQLPVEIGYRLASLSKSPKGRANAEMLGLMVNEPHISPEELAKLTMHTLVIAGENDMILDSHTRLIARHLPNSVLEILPGDHFIANKEPDCFNHAVDLFLRSTEGIISDADSTTNTIKE